DGAGVRGRAQDVRADSTGDVDDDVSRPERPGGGELVDDAGQCGVGDGEDQQFAGPGDGGGIGDPRLGEPARGQVPRLPGPCDDGGDDVSARFEGGAHGGADPSRRDQADGQAGGGCPGDAG